MAIADCNWRLSCVARYNHERDKAQFSSGGPLQVQMAALAALFDVRKPSAPCVCGCLCFLVMWRLCSCVAIERRKDKRRSSAHVGHFKWEMAALAALFVVRNTARLAFVPLNVLAGFPFTCNARSEMPDAKSEISATSLLNVFRWLWLPS